MNKFLFHEAACWLLRAIAQREGADPGAVLREGMLATPERFAKAWLDWTRGYSADIAGLLVTTFTDGAENYDEIVLIRDIPVYSHCEHHLAPFWGVAHVGYLPDKRIVGLSKILRVVDAFARRLQVQERMTRQIAEAMNEHLSPRGVAVIVECRHMCIESRGVERVGSITTTSKMTGVFLEGSTARAEFLSLLGRRP